MEKSCYVFIYLPGQLQAVPAGIFTYDPGQKIGIFQYGRRYLERPDALPADPVALPLDREPLPVTTNEGVYGALRDASPDLWGRTVIAHEKRVAVSAMDEVDFLLSANASRIGNLDFRDALSAPEAAYSPPTFQSLEDLMDAAGRLQESQPIRPDLEQLLLQGSSIGGARPKCTVLWNNALWIAKFPSRGDDFNNARVEFATMTLAEKCGIEIPDLQVLTIGDKDVLMVRRFDRWSVPRGFARHGLVSALSFMQWGQTDRGAFSYVAIADRMRQAGMAVGAALEELYTRMLFNMFCRNTDDHPRNHAMLIEGGRLRLSPAYDITPAPARLGVGTDFSLVMEIGRQGRHASVENALSRHASFGLRQEGALHLVRRVASVTAGWERHFRECGVSDADIEKFRGSFDSDLQQQVKALPVSDLQAENANGYEM